MSQGIMKNIDKYINEQFDKIPLIKVGKATVENLQSFAIDVELFKRFSTQLKIANMYGESEVREVKAKWEEFIRQRELQEWQPYRNRHNIVFPKFDFDIVS
jgi:hypothetical protein